MQTGKQVEKVLDARLIEAARMVSSLITDHRIEIASAADSVEAVNRASDFDHMPVDYNRQLSCQIWSLHGKLVGRSQSAPEEALATNGTGFQSTTINGVDWRVYAVENPTLGVRVLVGDSIEIRKKLVRSVVLGFMGPMALALPVLALLIWVSVNRGLVPLNQIASGLSKRNGTDLSPINDDTSPSEIRPVIRALNSLFNRVSDLRLRERNFLTYAAHELKTPLAGLKTHAQIAVKSQNVTVQQQALQQIITSVDRTSRMVRQLIDMAAVDTMDKTSKTAEINPTQISHDLVADLNSTFKTHLKSIDLRVASDVKTTRIYGTALLINLALRNVLENALQYAPSNGTVSCSISMDGDCLIIKVLDQGKGVEPELYNRLTEPFYRASHDVQSGSGLGLAIVSMSVERMRGSLAFEATEHGFLVTMSLPTVQLGSDDADETIVPETGR